MNETSTSNATDAKPVVEKTNITVDALVARRMGEMNKRRETPAEPPADNAPKPNAEEPKPAQESKVEEPKAEAKSDDVLSQVDLSKLTDEQITEAAKRSKSGLLNRLAELAAEKNQERAERLALQNSLNKKGLSDVVEPKVDNNPYEELTTLEEVALKYQEVDDVIEWGEGVLDMAEDLRSDEIAAVVDGQNLTKAQVKESLRKARKAKDKYLPAQFKELQGREVRKLQRNAFDLNARQELPWMEKEDSEPNKAFKAMMADPRLKKLEAAVPELAPQMGYILAHAANSIHGRKSLSLEPEKPKVTSVKVNPPENPSSSAAASERNGDRGDKDVKVLNQRYRESGKMEDYVALRTAQSTTKRKKLA